MTENERDWTKVVETKTLTRLSLFSVMIFENLEKTTLDRVFIYPFILVPILTLTLPIKLPIFSLQNVLHNDKGDIILVLELRSDEILTTECC